MTGPSVRASVLQSWVTFNQDLEGIVYWMYLDALGYVTTGMGNKIDPLPQALPLPWLEGGAAAPASDITAAWNAVDALRTAPKGTVQPSGPATQGGFAFQGYTSLRLTSAGVQTLVSQVLAQDEATIRKYFPGWDNFPADGQMGILSMAWAMGPGFPAGFPQFTAAVNRADWATAGSLSNFRGTGVAARIAKDKVCFANAAVVVANGLDPTVLYWPNKASGVVPPSSGNSSGGSGWIGPTIILAALGTAAGYLYEEFVA